MQDKKSSSSWFRLDSQRMLDNVDYFAVALAISLPLSTSATAILAALWFLAVLPTLCLQEVRREVMTFDGGLPVLLVLIAVVGMLWTDANWYDRAAGVRPFLKLLAIPLLLVQFQRSDRGFWVMYGLLAGCVLLMITSFTEMFLVTALVPGKAPGIVVKDYISQSGFFVICCYLLLELAEQAWIAKRVVLCSALVALMAAFLINITYVATSRTTLVVLPVLLLLFGLRRNWKIAVSACVLCGGLFLVAWDSSPYLQGRLESAFSIAANDNRLEAVSNRQRLAYWEASIDLIKQAPLVGHGTGSIRGMFQLYAAAGPDSDVNRVANPHNQTFVVALQLGIIGTIALYGMWFAHAKLFSRPGIAAWFGLVVVAQNFVSSLINSHLSDFTQGWTYAVCVGVAGGMVQRRSSLSTAESAQDAATGPEAREGNRRRDSLDPMVTSFGEANQDRVRS